MATESFNTSMNFNMFIQISSLCEAKLAILEWTNIRSLISMNSQMIKKVVPFTEPFITPFMITFQHLNMTFASRIFICEYAELFSIRYVFLDLYRSKIECLPSLHCDHHIPADFLECLAYFPQCFGLDLFSRLVSHLRVMRLFCNGTRI